MNTTTGQKPFEERLSDIVIRVEKSGWPDEDKEALYAKISEYLHSVVLPVVLKYTPGDELKGLVGKATVDSFVALMKKPLTDPNMYKELNSTAHEVLDDVEIALSKGGIL